MEFFSATVLMGTFKCPFPASAQIRDQSWLWALLLVLLVKLPAKALRVPSPFQLQVKLGVSRDFLGGGYLDSCFPHPGILRMQLDWDPWVSVLSVSLGS